MKAQDRFEQFLQGIDDYIAGADVKPPEFDEDYKVAENLTMEEMQKLTRDECFDYAFLLTQYSDHIASERHRQQTILYWCESNLNKIIINDYFQQPEFTKHDLKMAAVLKENQLADKIDKWRLTAQCRVTFLEGREKNVRKKAELLHDKGRRK